jgi:tripartite-type tricarboxylate transporter receptor subunit TctC
MLAKDVDFGFDTTATSTAHVRSGAFRALAVTTAARAAALPDVPSLQEAGLPRFDLGGVWFNLAVVRRTPAPIVARLTEALEAIRTPALNERLRTAFIEPLAVPRAENDRFVAESAARWQAIARELRLGID